MIIDMHMHVDELPGLGWSMPASRCIETMDEAGISAAVIMTVTDIPEVNPNALELIAGEMTRYPGRLFGFARIHPWYAESIKVLDRAVLEHGFRGLKLHPVSTLAQPSGAESMRLIRRAGELGIPTLFHCGDDPMTTPLAIADAAARCPEAQIILGHMGGYGHTDEAIRVAELHSNIILETSACPYPEKIVEAVARVGAERVIFGSDGPVCSPVLEVEKIRMCGFSAEDEALILGDNAQTLLGLS